VRLEQCARGPVRASWPISFAPFHFVAETLGAAKGGRAREACPRFVGPPSPSGSNRALASGGGATGHWAPPWTPLVDAPLWAPLAKSWPIVCVCDQRVVYMRHQMLLGRGQVGFEQKQT